MAKTTEEKGVRTVVFLDEKDLSVLTKIKEEQGVPVSWSIRKAVSEYIARRKSAPTKSQG